MSRRRNDDDFLDGCDLSRMPPEFRVRDENIPWIVLFASVHRLDRDAIERRAQEWRELFGAA
jgi:hypothetical protein